MSITIRSADPDHSIAHFVQSFWMLENASDKDIPSTVLPDGIVDLILLRSGTEPFQTVLRGVDTQPSHVVLTPKVKMFAVGFKLLAIEYLLKIPVSGLLNEGEIYTDELWQFGSNDLDDFELFCRKASEKIRSVVTGGIDERKKKLFELLYASNGSLSVKEISEKVYWSARQINRYFNQQFGIPLKSYCNILRFRASFDHISQGKLFPEQNFFDQAHFIKEVKKLSGALPKELKQNKNGRFLQFTALAKK
ncbi:MAG: helix-turn-helix transcriptional regulator [Chitinophagaceae bacterium]|nr:helix-turn-helix transcriptional regulator [Chitinophagaceae bacterium]